MDDFPFSIMRVTNQLIWASRGGVVNWKVIARAVESLFGGVENRPIHRHSAAILQAVIKRVIQAERLDNISSKVLSRQDGVFILDRILDVLQIKLPLSERDRSMIPASGPLVVVANHPFGGVEGIMLGAIINSIRSNLRSWPTICSGISTALNCWRR